MGSEIPERQEEGCELMSDPCFLQEEAKLWESWWVNPRVHLLPQVAYSTEVVLCEEPACQSRRPMRHGEILMKIL